VANKLIEENISVFEVHPNKVHHYAIATGCIAKTDKISAHVLAKYLQSNEGQVTHLNKNYKENKNLRDFQSRLSQLKAMLHAEQCRSQYELSKALKKSHGQTIKFLAKQIEQLEKVVAELIQNNKTYSEKAKLLQSYKGVGKVCAQALILGMPELGSIKRAEVSSLLGVAPLNNDSGKKEGRRKIRGGRFDIRKLLYMAALVASKHNPDIKEYYDGLLARGKLKKVALVAVMRKIICTLNAMVRDNKPWQCTKELAAQNG